MVKTKTIYVFYFCLSLPSAGDICPLATLCQQRVVQLRAVLRPAESDGEDLQRRHPGGEGANRSQLPAQQVLQAEEDAEHQDVPGVAAAGQPAGVLLGAAEERPGQADDDPRGEAEC